MNGSPLFTLKDLLYLFYLFPFRILATILPVRMIRLSGIPLSYIYTLLSVSKQKFLQTRLALAFNNTKTRRDLRRISNHFIRNAVFRVIDDLILNRLRKTDLLECSQIEGLDNLEAALSAKKGVILVSGHFFCNRVGKRFLSEIGFPVLSVRNEFPRDPLIGKIGAKYLKACYIEFLNGVIKDYVFIQDKGFSLKIMKRLRQNGLVNVHIDAPFSYHTIQHPLLGKERSFPVGFLKMVYLTDAVVLPMVCIGDSSSFSIIFEKKLEIQKISDNERFVAVNLERLVTALESQILQYPDQWELWVRL